MERERGHLIRGQAPAYGSGLTSYRSDAERYALEVEDKLPAAPAAGAGVIREGDAAAGTDYDSTTACTSDFWDSSSNEEWEYFRHPPIISLQKQLALRVLVV